MDEPMLYTGHTPPPWRVARVEGVARRRRVFSGAFRLEGEIREVDAQLMADAPVILAQRDSVARRAVALSVALDRLLREAEREEAPSRDALDEARAALMGEADDG